MYAEKVSTFRNAELFLSSAAVLNWLLTLMVQKNLCHLCFLHPFFELQMHRDKRSSLSEFALERW
jgi:hypothetical protein